MGLHRKKTFEELKVVLNNIRSTGTFVDVEYPHFELAVELAHEQQCVIDQLGKKIKNYRLAIKQLQGSYDRLLSEISSCCNREKEISRLRDKYLREYILADQRAEKLAKRIRQLEDVETQAEKVSDRIGATKSQLLVECKDK